MNIIDKVMKIAEIRNQSDLAQICGVTQGWISRCRYKNQISFQMLKKISSRLNIPPHELAPELFEGYERKEGV